MSFQKTVVAVFFKTVVAVVLKLLTVVAVIIYNFNVTTNWNRKKNFQQKLEEFFISFDGGSRIFMFFLGPRTH